MDRYMDVANCALKLSMIDGDLHVTVAECPGPYFAYDADTLSKWLKQPRMVVTCPNDDALLANVREKLTEAG